jgi:hypothetical protein
MQYPPYRSTYPRDLAKPSPLNSNFYCHRDPHSNVVHVFTTGAYLLAEYDVRNDSFSWQRLLPANQKLTIEEWIREKFPMLKPVVKELAKAKAASR